MLLAIDAGNSSVGFGIFDGANLAVSFKAETRPGATPDEYWSFVSSQMERSGIAEREIEAIAISSVVPPLVPIFFEAFKGISDAPPLLVSPRLKLGIKLSYGTPDTLGPDRLASAAAAFTEHGGPVVVVDFGTATTFSVVDAEGAFIGGAIAPGLLTGYYALVEKASGLPKVGLTHPKNRIGTTTGEGLTSGLIYGHAAMAEGMLARMSAELGSPCKTVATGGLAGLVAPHVEGIASVDPHLTLKGIAAIYRRNS
jgi:type III pantothenate kinase